MRTCLGTWLGTWECVWERGWELVWEHGSVCGNLFGNIGACVGTCLGTWTRVWEIVVGNVLGDMGTTRRYMCSWWVMDMGTMNCSNTYIHACLHNMHHVHCLHTILIIIIISWHIQHYTTHLETYSWHIFEKPYIKVMYTPHMKVCHLLQCAYEAIVRVWTKNIGFAMDRNIT